MSSGTLTLEVSTRDGRIERDLMFMSMALLVSQRSTCLRGSVGAIFTRDNRIISTGYNGSPSGQPHCSPDICNQSEKCQNSIHAEANGIAFAAKHGVELLGSTLYVTSSPCLACAGLLINAGISKVVYLNRYHDMSGIHLLTDSGVVVRNTPKGQLVLGGDYRG